MTPRHWQDTCHCLGCQVCPSGCTWVLTSDQGKKRRSWHNSTCRSPQGNACQSFCGSTFSIDLVFFSIRQHWMIHPHQARKASSAQKQQRVGREKALQVRFCRGTDHFWVSALPLIHFSVATLSVPVAFEEAALCTRVTRALSTNLVNRKRPQSNAKQSPRSAVHQNSVLVLTSQRLGNDSI